MRNTPPRASESVCVCLALCLIPRAAFAHGETLLVWMFYEVATIPWAIMVYVLAREKIVERVASNRLGPSTVMATLGAIIGGWFVLVALAEALADPSPLSPLLLAVAGAPGVWYLWRQRAVGLVLFLLLIPILLTGTCAAVAWSPP